jgi:hypothetical protein
MDIILPSIEQDGLNSELLISKDHEEDVICLICSCIVYNPVSCAKCTFPFCKKCIDVWKTKSSKCPNNCDFEEVKLNTFAKKLLDKLSLRCYNFKDGCQTEVKYQDFDRHIREQCDFTKHKCTACGFLNKRSVTATHINTCEEVRVDCPYCRERFKRKDLNGHVKTCPQRIEPCEHCKKQIQYNAYQNHLNICEYVKITCGYCRDTYMRKDEMQHILNACRDKIKELKDKEIAELKKVIDFGKFDGGRSRIYQENDEKPVLEGLPDPQTCFYLISFDKN